MAARQCRREAQARNLKGLDGGGMSSSSPKVGQGRERGRLVHSPAGRTNRALSQVREGKVRGQLKGREGTTERRAVSSTDSCRW